MLLGQGLDVVVSNDRFDSTRFNRHATVTWSRNGTTQVTNQL
ncbi:protein of unknown function [Pararobbsia alpina]